ncbi:MAG TPA: secondary thiamine-phosphate synthase enzyme YjbQ [Candidatus Acidoferrales bacterium]|nr:secondary thiamine-phosphate synthase enzyme YjbQ [Candidatus Acidoferrales bacterium]
MERTNKLRVKTSRRTELVNITAQVAKMIAGSGVQEGVCQIYVPHTTAGVIINEGYDPDVVRDLEATLDRLVPRDAGYRHAEGNSDSHIKVALVSTSQTVFVEAGRPALGRWQAIFFCEFDGPREREVFVRVSRDS